MLEKVSSTLTFFSVHIKQNLYNHIIGCLVYRMQMTALSVQLNNGTNSISILKLEDNLTVQYSPAQYLCHLAVSNHVIFSNTLRQFKWITIHSHYKFTSSETLHFPAYIVIEALHISRTFYS